MCYTLSALPTSNFDAYRLQASKVEVGMAWNKANLMPRPSGNEAGNGLETGILYMYSGVSEVVFFALTCFLTTYLL